MPDLIGHLPFNTRRRFPPKGGHAHYGTKFQVLSARSEPGMTNKANAATKRLCFGIAEPQNQATKWNDKQQKKEFQ